MGWFKESRRHSLAAGGIKTGRKITNYAHVSKEDARTKAFLNGMIPWNEMTEAERKDILSGIDVLEDDDDNEPELFTLDEDELPEHIREQVPLEGIPPIDPIVTEDEFNRYERVRQSGATNMLDVKRVSMLSGLDVDTIKHIIHNYGELADEYLGPAETVSVGDMLDDYHAKKKTSDKRPELTKTQLDQLDELDMSFLEYGHGDEERQRFMRKVMSIGGMTEDKAKEMWEYELRSNESTSSASKTNSSVRSNAGFISPNQINDDIELFATVQPEVKKSVLNLMDQIFPGFKKRLIVHVTKEFRDVPDARRKISEKYGDEIAFEIIDQ